MTDPIPEADALEQNTPTDTEPDPDIPENANPADAAEQQREVPLDDEYR